MGLFSLLSNFLIFENSGLFYILFKLINQFSLFFVTVKPV